MPASVATAAAVLGVLTVLRAFAAFHIPLTGDEAYYWTWSLHPAFGYTDHPPLVAWLIWLGTKLGVSAGFVRLPFVICEAIAAIAVGRAATIVSGNVRAGAIATVLFALIPQTKLAIGEALPDGAYMAAWGLALWAAAALDRKPSPRAAVGLGLALAATVLARTFGWALVAGIVAWALAPQRRGRIGKEILAALALAVVCYVPFVVWNAQHDWENFAFTFHTRQHFALAATRLVDISTIRFAVYAALLAVVTWFVALRREPRITLVAWTALPLPAALLAFSFVTTTESYWIIGPAASVAIGAGIVLDRSRSIWRRAVIGVLGIGTAYATAAALFLTLPEGAQAGVFSAVPALRAPFESGVFVYAPLAQRLKTLSAAGHDATILTDRYETSAELLWYGVDSQIAVALPQQRQWERWHAGDAPSQHALLVTFATRPSGAGSQSEIELSFAGAPLDVYWVTPVDGRNASGNRGSSR